ncbi:GcrA family cell cycle regulator [Bradyrhizobium prioriisuperbiae]|uniref:GcrA family cell cycle regulator n=1 Tax=Bradyrhizobium prioriisuperbiae TaxID=2854389 RepID=UPI0028E7C8A9|nr:GcrA family cell cycle regulator [Bradyrhizobium prioritasuperba]
MPGKGRAAILDDEDLVRFADLWKQGVTTPEIAAAFGDRIVASTVCKIAKRLGLESRKPISWTPEREAQLRDLWDTNSCRDIAAIMGGTSKSRVRDKARTMGLRVRHPAGWTDKKVEILKELWLGPLSCEQIGEQLGFGKNKVIGKARRLGLPDRTDESLFDPIVVAARKQQSAERQKETRALWTQEQRDAATAKIRDWSASRAKPQALPKTIKLMPGQSKTSAVYRNKLGRAPEMTKSQARDFLAQAMQRTAAMQAEGAQ